MENEHEEFLRGQIEMFAKGAIELEKELARLKQEIQERERKAGLSALNRFRDVLLSYSKAYETRGATGQIMRSYVDCDDINDAFDKAMQLWESEREKENAK